MASAEESDVPQYISITPLLKRLWPSPAENKVTADEIASAISLIFTDNLSPVQTGALLTCLHFTGWDRRADVIAKCAKVMRAAASQVDGEALVTAIQARGKQEGDYGGGLCDIVGTGGDSHSTFNISTTSSIVASSFLLLSKHGNRAATSKSGSADLLNCTLPIPPNLMAVTPKTIAKVYEKSNYSFLFAPVFHPGMKYVAPIRKELGWRTIFNLLGPLTNPVEGSIEARLLGVARRDIGPVFAEALKMSGARKAMVVCGEEDLDEISCAGETYCWRLGHRSSNENDSADNVEVESFILSPADFGLPAHALSEVSPGKEPQENAAILTKLLQNQLPQDDPILHFVLINTAALLVVSGICEADTSNTGHGDDGKVIPERGPGGGRWKEGVRRARWAIESANGNKVVALELREAQLARVWMDGGLSDESSPTLHLYLYMCVYIYASVGKDLMRKDTMSKPQVLLLGEIEHAHKEWSDLSSIADIIEPKARSREEFLEEAKSGAFDKVVAAYRTFLSVAITGLIDEELVETLPKSMKFIAHNGAGYDQISIDTCTDHGIRVSNVPTAVDDATADTNMFLILGALRGFNASMLGLRSGHWKGSPPPPLGHDPQGKILGILGMGGIGRNLMKKASAFGMTTQYYNRSQLSEELSGGAKYKRTRHIISTREFEMMKKGVVIVNTARGAVMDEEALVQALDNGTVWSCGLDVFEEEPKVPAGLIANPHVMLLPHMGTWTVETQTKMEIWCIDNVRSAIETGKLKSPVGEQKNM
ncbi:hypothetical protein B7494_g3190 [Chlorociboria aeruginascens]|nr:hypothetical protein B7494_g3190 [Chlorociboria aeruginascens]